MHKPIRISGIDIKIQSITPLFTDNRGWIASADGSPDNIDQIKNCLQPRLLSTIPGVPRGNHYHLTETETIIFLNSAWKAVFADTEGKQVQEVNLDCSKHPIKIVIPPKITHVFVNKGKHNGYIFHYSDQPYTINRSIKQEIL